MATLLLVACVPTRRAVVVEPSSRSYRSQARTPTPVAAASYRVMRGDTLYAIAFRHGLDFRNLAAWNGIAPPYTIRPGQQLRLSAPSGAARSQGVVAPVAARRPLPTPSTGVVTTRPRPVAPAVRVGLPAPAAPVATPALDAPRGATRSAAGVLWRWPADGTLIKRFQSGDAIPGIELGGSAGDPVRAAADGVVVYSGNGLVGYGELIIIKHNDDFLSAYGHNRKRLVKEGQRVNAGQLIAEMGSTGASRDELQFQIRRDGNPVDPLEFLPAR
jgi:lipoprotein NlpD